MKIVIKKLQGEELTIEVEASNTIISIKSKLESILKIPTWRQKLLLMGKSLVDEMTVSDYGAIKEGSKINLVIKDIEPFDGCLQKYFRKHFSEEESVKFVRQVNSEITSKVNDMSLDDIARLIDYYQEENMNVQKYVS